MSLSPRDVETLRAVKPLLSRIVGEETDRAVWGRQLPPDATDVLDRLARASNEDFEIWSERLVAEDPELVELVHEILSRSPEAPAWIDQASVFNFANRITEVEFSAHLSFEIEDPRPIIRLIFLAGEESDRLVLTSDQDLEDTLHVGRAICAAISETLHLAQEHRIPLLPEHFGEHFGEILDELEETTRALRRCYNRARKPSKKRLEA